MTDNWQPIEAAPRDGTRILAFDRGAGVTIAYFDDEDSAWIDCLVPEHLDGSIGPTHWQPLPSPPSA